jgi:hypothetical protein
MAVRERVRPRLDLPSPHVDFHGFSPYAALGTLFANGVTVRPPVGRQCRTSLHIMVAVRRPTTARSRVEGASYGSDRSQEARDGGARLQPGAPVGDASYAPVVQRLEASITRMETAAGQQQGGYATKRSSVVRRQQLRQRLQHELLRHLVTVAEDAAQEDASVAALFRLPKGNEPNKAFLTVAEQMLVQGQAHAELFKKHGLAEKLLEDLAAAVGQFEKSLSETSDGRREHVGARVELDAVSEEVARLVEVLDGFNRYRFAGDANRRAEWESARHVESGPRKEAPAGAAEGAPTEEVKPAA